MSTERRVIATTSDVSHSPPLTTRHDISPPPLTTTSGITFRAVCLAFICIVFICVAGCFSAFLRYDLIGTGHLPRSALWPVLLFVGLAAIHRMRDEHVWIVHAVLYAVLSLFIVGECAHQQVPWVVLGAAMLIGTLSAIGEFIRRKQMRSSDSFPQNGGGATFSAAGILQNAWWIAGVALAGASAAGWIPRESLFAIVPSIGLRLLLGVVRSRFNLSRTEMLFIYCALLVTSAIPGQQFATYFYLQMVGPVYYATPQNQYFDLFGKHFPSWLVPSTDPNDPVVKWCFEPMPRGASIPYPGWAGPIEALVSQAPDWMRPALDWTPFYLAWARPILMWTPYVIALFFVTVCFSALLRRQWVDRERLLFPLAEVPLEVTDYGDGRAVPPLFRNWLFYVFFAIPIVIHSLKALSFYYPNLYWIDLYASTGNMFSERPWTTLNNVQLMIYFDMIGITYLLTTEMGFSWWFFYALRRGNVLVRTQLGLENHDATMQQQGIGAFILLGLFYLWVMRGHIRDVLRRAFGNATDVDDASEPISYRMAVIGIVLGLATIFTWTYMLGLSLVYAVFLFVAYFGGILVLTRMVSEAGLFVFWVPISPQSMVIQSLNNQAAGGFLDSKQITLLQLVGWKLQDSASNILPNALQGFKVADSARMNQRILFCTMLIAIVVAVFACHIPAIYVCYKYTIPHFGWWMKGSGARGLTNQVIDNIVRPQGFKPWEWSNMALGALVAGALTYLRSRFLWWPLHPLGYAGAFSTWFGNRYGFSIFIGWLLKVIVLKAGGARLWRKCRPAALGLIVGNCFILFFWLIVELIWQVGDKVVVIE